MSTHTPTIIVWQRLQSWSRPSSSHVLAKGVLDIGHLDTRSITLIPDTDPGTALSRVKGHPAHKLACQVRTCSARAMSNSWSFYQWHATCDSVHVAHTCRLSGTIHILSHFFPTH